VQLQKLAAIFGGYNGAGHYHFYGMVVLVFFLFLHVSVAFAIKETVQSMFTGRLSKAQQEKLDRR
jgi:thiosulfate reductase cytochrome b subunit